MTVGREIVSVLVLVLQGPGSLVEPLSSLWHNLNFLSLFDLDKLNFEEYSLPFEERSLTDIDLPQDGTATATKQKELITVESEYPNFSK
jgi:hypothetical protein